MSERSRKLLSQWWKVTILSLSVTLLVAKAAQAQVNLVDDSLLTDSVLNGTVFQDEFSLNQPVPSQSPVAPPVSPQPTPTPVPEPQNDPPPPQIIGGPFGFLFAGAFAASEEPPQLARSPDFFGDSFLRAFGSDFSDNGTKPIPDYDEVSVSGLPAAGVFQRLRISESNKALPVNRVFFHYNHFHNAVRLQRDRRIIGQRSNSFSVDNYVMGVERVFDDGYSSIEIRMPFTTDGNNYEDTDFQVKNGNVGNLSVILKRMIHETQSTIVAIGLGINTPTGSDMSGVMPQGPTRFAIDNEAVHFIPFIGFLNKRNDRLFVQGFAQVDVAANGNPIQIISNTPTVANEGVYNEQAMLSLDAAGGYWLLKDRQGHRLTGLAAVVELHYTTSLQDTDSVSANDGSIVFKNTLNRFDVINMTLGMHAQINQMTDVRLGGVVPLRNSQNRFFDSELMVSVVRRY